MSEQMKKLIFKLFHPLSLSFVCLYSLMVGQSIHYPSTLIWGLGALFLIITITLLIKNIGKILLTMLLFVTLVGGLAFLGLPPQVGAVAVGFGFAVYFFIKRIEFLKKHSWAIFLGLMIYSVPFAISYIYYQGFYVDALFNIKSGSFSWSEEIQSVTIWSAAVLTFLLGTLYKKGYDVKTTLLLISIAPLIILLFLLPFLKIGFDFDVPEPEIEADPGFIPDAEFAPSGYSDVFRNSTVVGIEKQAVDTDVSPEISVDNIPEGFSEVDPDLWEYVVDNVSLADSWHCQLEPNSCAIAVQTDILNDLGVQISEAQLIVVAKQLGIYNPETGTTLSDVGRLLKECNVPLYDKTTDFSVADLLMAKEAGEKVLVGVDSTELYDKLVQSNETLFGDKVYTGHAVEFKNVIVHKDGSLFVVLDDPGKLGGHNIVCEMSAFCNAWSDYGKFAIITNTQGAINV